MSTPQSSASSGSGSNDKQLEFTAEPYVVSCHAGEKIKLTATAVGPGAEAAAVVITLPDGTSKGGQGKVETEYAITESDYKKELEFKATAAERPDKKRWSYVVNAQLEKPGMRIETVTGKPADLGNGTFECLARDANCYGFIGIDPWLGKDEKGNKTVKLKDYVSLRIIQNLNILHLHRTFVTPVGGKTGEHKTTNGSYIQDGFPAYPDNADEKASTDKKLKIHFKDDVGIRDWPVKMYNETTWDLKFVDFLDVKIAEGDWKILGRICWRFQMTLTDGAAGLPKGESTAKYEPCDDGAPNGPVQPVVENPPTPPQPPWEPD